MNDNRGIAPMATSGNLAENWKMWRARFENYLVATEINKKSEETQCAQLLHYIGEEGFKVYETFTFEQGEKNKIATLLEKFQAHFTPKENLAYERFKFFTYKQQPGDTVEQFITELKNKALRCKFGTLQDSLIKTMITCGVNNNEIRKQLLQNDDLTLDKAIEKCMIIDLTKVRSNDMEKTNDQEVEAIQQSKSVSGNMGRNGSSNNGGGTSYSKNRNQFSQSKQNNNNNSRGYDDKLIDCNRCGRSHVVNRCPAYVRDCKYCRMKNHFASQCFEKKSDEAKKVHDIACDDENKDYEDYLFIGSIDIDKINSDVWMHELNIKKNSFQT